MRTLIVLSTSLLLLLGGCANLQGMKVAAPPESLKGRGIVHSGQAAADVKIAPNAYRIGDGTFVAQSAGGSAAVGLLFGVVGALVNTATISAESERVRDAVSPGSVARLEPATEFARAWKESGLPDAVDPQAARIESFVIFYLDNAREKVHVVPGLRVSGPGLKAADGASEWVGHYLLATERALLPKKLNEPLSPEELVEHSSTLRAAYGELLKEVALDLRSGPAPRRMVANINAPALKATVMGFAGFTSGDVDMAPDGRLAMRVNIENYGPAMTRANPYFVWVFPTGKQYSFEVGPEERRSSP